MKAEEALKISEHNSSEPLKTILNQIKIEAKRGFRRLTYLKDFVPDDVFEEIINLGYNIHGKDDENSKFYQIRW